MDGRWATSNLSWKQTAVATLVAAALVATVATITVNVPWADPSPRLSCMNNMGQLAQCFVIKRQNGRLDPTLHGSAQIVSWLGADGLVLGNERVFFCPGDDSAAPPETPEERRRFHPVDTAALRRAVGLGSYAVRDFEKWPLDEHALEKEIILCDRQGENGRTMHHKGVVVVAFATGDVRSMSREELGLRPDEPIVVGPDSSNAELRKMERP
jgi:hypothetical protein